MSQHQNSLRFRQVHLDFHTSEAITPVAKDFDPDEFADTLARAHIDSVTCFSRCHHGMIYHDTQFDARHPGLTCNLLAEQINACHKRDIRVPIYITVGFDEYMAHRHPEWLEIAPDGKPNWHGPLQAGWHKLCLNVAPYLDYLDAQITEVMLTMPAIDGLFFDILLQSSCACPWCIASMKAKGMNPADEKARKSHAAQVLVDARRFIKASVRKHHTTCSIFFNSGHIYPELRQVIDCFTHFEVESLPSGGWGYDHFPVAGRYARTFNMPFLGMTGRFHKSWGDFGGYKNLAALEYECFTSLAETAQCSIGDQLHPSGKLDPYTYELIGNVYDKVEQMEPYCVSAKVLSEIAVFNPEAIGVQDSQVDSSLAGAYLALAEKGHQFDVVDQWVDWSGYKVLILPDKIYLDEMLRDKVNAFLKLGGKILLTHHAGLDAESKSAFVVDSMPCVYHSEAVQCPDYLSFQYPWLSYPANTRFVLYEHGVEVEALADAKVSGQVWWSYFDRSWEHFCSHVQAPPAEESPYPALVYSDNIAYCSYPLFGMYKRHGARVYKEIVLDMLNHLLPEPLVGLTAPATLRVSLTEQPQEKRHVLHLLHYIPEKRFGDVPVIEEKLPVYNIKIGVRIPKPDKVYLVPDMQALPFKHENGRIHITVPEVNGYCIVVFQH